ncbi:MAG: helix-turn-helix transcriptional regulator [Actinomycetota bacterium]
MRGGHLVREARRRAGLSQAELARRSGTTQSSIARLESGDSSPSLEHITALLKGCGFDLQVRLAPYDDHDLSLARENLRLTPEERLANLLHVQELARTARPAD